LLFKFAKNSLFPSFITFLPEQHKEKACIDSRLDFSQNVA